MPKIVDHERRRQELGAVVWRLIARDGIEGVSIRDVAAESGWSSGALRHYFKTREQLLSYAAGLVVNRVRKRIERPSTEASLPDGVRAILRELLPLDGERRTEATIWLAFVSRSLVHPAIADPERLAFDALHDLCRRIMSEVAGHGLLVEGLGVEQEADRLHALLDGWALHLLMGRLDPPAALAAVDSHLRQIIDES